MMTKHAALPDDVNVDDLPLVRSGYLTEADARLAQLFTEIDGSAIDRLSDGGKRLVEWGTAALGIFFASLALLQNPAALAAFRGALPKQLGMAVVIGYLLAILGGFFASLPLRYRYSPQNVTLMEEQLQKAFRNKYRLLVGGSLVFVLASLALGGLIITILLSI